MKHNIYQCIFKEGFELKKINKTLSVNLKSRLNVIEMEIINEFFKKQKGKIGIRTLGNEIRYNKLIQNQMGETQNNEVLLKMTEHHRSFLFFFCDKLVEFLNENIYFLILSKEFGKSSHIVDLSFPGVNEITEQLSNLATNFNLKKNRNILFIEIESFEKYYFEKINNNYRKKYKF